MSFVAVSGVCVLFLKLLKEIGGIACVACSVCFSSGLLVGPSMSTESKKLKIGFQFLVLKTTDSFF